MVENESEEVKIEYKKMVNGELYEAAKLNHLLMDCKEILFDFNNLRPKDLDKREEILKKII